MVMIKWTQNSYNFQSIIKCIKGRHQERIWTISWKPELALNQQALLSPSFDQWSWGHVCLHGGHPLWRFPTETWAWAHARGGLWWGFLFFTLSKGNFTSSPYSAERLLTSVFASIATSELQKLCVVHRRCIGPRAFFFFFFFNFPSQETC